MTLNIKNLLKISICAIALLLIGCSDHAIKFNNVDITGSKAFGKSFTLTDHHGQQRRLEDFHGRLVVMFFGYTHCPDICPTTMSEMQHVMELLSLIHI